MMRTPTKILGITAALSAMLFYACSKYKDPPNAEPVNTGSYYCNDSRAINYNWGFPGTPDNKICVYPVDSMLGGWVFTDSIFLPDGSLKQVQTRNLNFASTEDTIFRHMAVSGWCSGAPIYITVDKYSFATVDTLITDAYGQLLCTTTDTVTGNFQRKTERRDTMDIDLTISATGGVTRHKGIALRQ